MPWKVRKSGDKYCVVKKTDDSTVACHETQAQARAQLRALYAAEPDAAATENVTSESAAPESASTLNTRELNLVIRAARERDVNIPGPGGHDLLKYWTRGPGAIKIRWGTDGSFDRCVRNLGKYVKNPQGLCAEYHKKATGEWPAEKGIPSSGELVELSDDIAELVASSSTLEPGMSTSTSFTTTSGDVDDANLDTPDAGDLNAAARRFAAKRGWALPDGSYPIRDQEHHGLADLDKAIRAVGRGSAPHDKIRRHIIKRARALEASDRIPRNWSASGKREEAAALAYPFSVEPLTAAVMMNRKKCSSGQHKMPDGSCMSDDEMPNDEPKSPMMTEYADEPWEGTLVVEGAESGDGRIFALGSLDWAQLPLPLLYQPANTGGHSGSFTVGEIAHAARRGNQVYGWGHVFGTALGGEHGDGIRNTMKVGGVSVDVDKVKDADVELVFNDDDDDGEPDRIGNPFAKPETTIFHRGRIRGATLVAFPAFVEAKLRFTGALAEASQSEGVVQAAKSDCGCGAKIDDSEIVELELDEDDETAVVVASADDNSTHTITIPNVPPASWFSEPTDVELSGALTITDEGRIYGLVAPANVTHRSVKTKVPRNVDFSRFHKAETIVRDGGRVVTGVITANCGHAPTQNYGTLDQRREHYDNSCSVLANARVGYTRGGDIWVAGALNPGADPAQVAQALGCTLSLDVQPHPDRPGVREFIAAHLVPVPGFPMARSRPSASYSDGVLSAAALPVEYVGHARPARPDAHAALEFVTLAKANLARQLGIDPTERKRELASRLGVDPAASKRELARQLELV